MVSEEQLLPYAEMVEKIASSFFPRIRGKGWLGREDLVQIGYISLIGALERLDKSKEAVMQRQFIRKTVSLSVLREIVNHDHILRVSYRFKNHAGRIHRSDNKDPEYWSKELGVPLGLVREYLIYLSLIYPSFDYTDRSGKQQEQLYNIPATNDDDEDDNDDDDEVKAWEKLIAKCCKDKKDEVILRLTYEGYPQRVIAEHVNMVPNHVYKRFRIIRDRYRRRTSHVN